MKSRRYFDIGVNLTDGMFHGIYNGKVKHAGDLDQVLKRAAASNVRGILVTGSCLKTSQEAIDICKKFSTPECRLYATVGVHPCSAATVPMEKEAREAYYSQLEKLAKEPEVKAFGELGLDYDRLHYASVEQQQQVFDEQLVIAKRLKLPLFLHSRNCSDDFYARIGPLARANEITGVVHSFTGTASEMTKLLEGNSSIYIGLNGCSSRSVDNLEVAKQVPLDRLLLETDAPWCDIRPSHPSYEFIKQLPFEVAKKPDRWKSGQMVKGRCEPCSVENVARVYAHITNQDLDLVASTVYKSTLDLLKLDSEE